MKKEGFQREFEVYTKLGSAYDEKVHVIMKSEPNVWSIDQQKKAGTKNNFSKKLINYLKDKNFKKFKLQLGNIDIHRDFGYAKEYVDAIYKINKSRDADDYIIATGKSTLVRNVIKFAFKLKNKNYLKFIKINKNKFKNKHVKNMSANINKIK
jgi:nucleoside-diphosphate-sugar epimerase